MYLTKLGLSPWARIIETVVPQTRGECWLLQVALCWRARGVHGGRLHKGARFKSAVAHG